MKKTVLIISILVVIAVVVGTVTFAVWRSRQYEENSVGKTSGDSNPSEKYFRYEAVVDEGEVVGLTVVGYDGEFVTAEIPETAEYVANVGTYSGLVHEYNVIAVSRKFCDNNMIETLIVPKTVATFEHNACEHFFYLTTVIFKDTSSHESKITLGDNCFVGCTNLNTLAFRLSTDDGLNYPNVTETGETYTVRKEFFESISTSAFIGTKVFGTVQGIRTALLA